MEKLLARTLGFLISFRIEDGNKRKKLAALHSSGRILDIGMTHSPNLHLTGEYVVGFDTMVPPKLPTNYFKFIQGDCVNLSAALQGEIFDTIIALEVIEHLGDWVEFFRQAYQCLSPKGKFILSTPSGVLWRTVLANGLFPKGISFGGRGVDGKIACRPYYGHVILHQPRILNAVAQELGFKLLNLRNSSRSLSLPFLQKNLLFVYGKL
jgi:SAM-dependent methyltransferase